MAETDQHPPYWLGMLRRVAYLPLTIPICSCHYGKLHWRAASNMVVFPDLGLAYNRVKKNANTSVLLLLRQLSMGVISERKYAKQHTRTLLDLGLRELRNLDNMHTFIVIRNPYSRVLSAFLDRFRRESDRRRYKPFDLTPEGFGQFLLWLEQGGLTRNGHWNLQHKRMIFQTLDAYDTVVRFETLRDDIMAMLKERKIDVNSNCLQELYPSDRGKRTAADSKLTLYYNQERCNRVARLYADDFECLGYSKTFPTVTSDHVEA